MLRSAPEVVEAMRTFERLRAAAAVVLVVAAVNHATLAVRGLGNVPRHAVFVGIDACLASLVAFRPRWALPAAMLVALQQVPSHGEDLVESLGGSIDWASVGVVIFFPALVILLAVERTASRREPRGGEPRRP